MDCSPPGSSIHGIFQASILEWVAIFSTRGSSQPGIEPCISCIAGRFLTHWAIREVPQSINISSNLKKNILLTAYNLAFNFFFLMIQILTRYPLLVTAVLYQTSESSLELSGCVCFKPKSRVSLRPSVPNSQEWGSGIYSLGILMQTKRWETQP